MRVVFHAHPLAASGVALERGFNERHGSSAIHSRREILLAADALPARDDGVCKIPVQVAEGFVVALGMPGRRAAGTLGGVTQISPPPPQDAHRLSRAAIEQRFGLEL